MRYLLISLLLLRLPVHSQVNVRTEVTELFRQIIQGDAPVIYVKESTDNSLLPECPTLTGASFLSRKEVRYVASALKNSNSFSWKDFPLANVKLISDAEYNAADKDILVQELQQNIFIISKPIFLHKGKYCVFFYQAVCGNICGSASMVLFKKTKGIWKQKEEYCGLIH